VPTLRAAIATLLADPYDVILARSILGTDDPAVIYGRVGRSYGLSSTLVIACRCSARASARYSDSISTTARASHSGVRLDGTPWGHGSLAELEAVYAAQTELHAAGPARRCWSGRTFGHGIAAIMSYLAHEPVADPTAATCAGAGARSRISSSSVIHACATRCRGRPCPRRCSGAQRAVRFTTPGGTWIDDRARAARAVWCDLRTDAVMLHRRCSNLMVTGGRRGQHADSVAWIDSCAVWPFNAVHHIHALGDTTKHAPISTISPRAVADRRRRAKLDARRSARWPTPRDAVPARRRRWRDPARGARRLLLIVSIRLEMLRCLIRDHAGRARPFSRHVGTTRADTAARRRLRNDAAPGYAVPIVPSST
jgi:hypothetical protein